MDNYAIADQLSLLSKLMDIHGEDAGRAKAYGSAAFTLENYDKPVANLSQPQLFRIRNIGESIGKKILELIETGVLPELASLLESTPAGVLEMLNIKGLGPKKINVLWKQLGIDNIGNLRQACLQNRLSATKGFGEKTEQKILEAIEFKEGNVGKYLYRQVESFAEAFTGKLQQKFKDHQTVITGEYRRQLEIISSLEWVTTVPKEELKRYILNDEVSLVEESEEKITLIAEQQLQLRFHLASAELFARKLFETSASDEFLEEWTQFSENADALSSEEEIFSAEGINYIPAYLRERGEIIQAAEANTFDDIIQVSDIKGLIHSHSNWSDGGHTIEEMALALIDLGFEYLVISDHSKAAYYAGGLTEDRIIQQHRYVDELNQKLHPFRIFKSIECDILSDGGLDYSDEILAGFDLVITSIHSNLDMPEEKAMKRLLGAITNPYTTILGHMTGRKLLKRSGYPVDYKTIIDACAANDVVIEINANPNRLDMDWRWIDYALERNVMLSIDPDAHTIDEFQLLKYGVLVAQKGGLSSSKNLSSMGLQAFEKFLKQMKIKKGIIH